jgi:hypothetical protein
VPATQERDTNELHVLHNQFSTTQPLKPLITDGIVSFVSQEEKKQG